MLDWNHVAATVVYAAIGVFIFALAYKVIEKIMPWDLNKELTVDDNTAVGVLMGSVMIGLAIIIAASIAS